MLGKHLDKVVRRHERVAYLLSDKNVVAGWLRRQPTGMPSGAAEEAAASLVRLLQVDFQDLIEAVRQANHRPDHPLRDSLSKAAELVRPRDDALEAIRERISQTTENGDA
jgi:hypothetical protein